MKYTLSDQLLSFGISILWGGGLGLFYEILRLFRVLAHGRKALTFFLDLLFMVVFSVASVLFSICYSRGNTRYFIVAGELSGLLIVRFTLGVLNVRFLVPQCKVIATKLRKIAVNIGKNLKKLLQVISNILYNKSRKKEPVSHNRFIHKFKERGKRHHGVKTAE